MQLNTKRVAFVLNNNFIKNGIELSVDITCLQLTIWK